MPTYGVQRSVVVSSRIRCYSGKCMYSRVLQLDARGEPLALVEWERACALLWRGAAQMIAYDPGIVIRSQEWETPAPLVIQLPELRADYVELSPDTVGETVVRDVLYARDNWQCQYCLEPVDVHNASMDHVRPVWMYARDLIARGQDASMARQIATTWENVVTCCKTCNYIKGGLLPIDCGMHPANTPRKPSYVKLWAGRRYHPIQAEYVAAWGNFDVDRLRVTRTSEDFDWSVAWSEHLERLLREAEVS